MYNWDELQNHIGEKVEVWVVYGNGNIKHEYREKGIIKGVGMEDGLEVMVCKIGGEVRRFGKGGMGKSWNVRGTNERVE